MPLILARHTQTNAPGLCYGRMDVPLAESFEDEASALLATLPPVERILTSPAARCQRLAGWLGARHGLVPIADDRFREMDFGSWEGRLWNDIPRHELDLWAEDFYGARPHGGESVSMLAARVAEGLARAASLPGATLIITHAGVIRAALAAGGDTSAWQAEIPYASAIALPQVPA